MDQVSSITITKGNDNCLHGNKAMHGMAAHTCSQAPAAAVPGMSPAPSRGGRVWQMSVRNQRCPPVVPATNSHTDLQEDKLIIRCRKLQCTNEYICRTMGQWD